jgi:hypothetical protein
MVKDIRKNVAGRVGTPVRRFFLYTGKRQAEAREDR